LRAALITPVVFVVASCQDVPTSTPDTPLLEIKDAVHSSGNPHFFFLPPLVPDPSVHFTAAFDDTLAPEVVICTVDGIDCTGTLATYTTETGPGSETVRVMPEEEHYLVNWHTDEFALDVGQTYRIRVAVLGTEVGHADVDVVGSGSDLRNVETNEYIALKDGRTLPIKFRIEDGAVPPAPPVTLRWLNAMNGLEAYSTTSVLEILGDVKISVCPPLGIPVSEAHNYFVSTHPRGDPLDEAKTLQELGLTQSSTVLYVQLTP
jgi:hypothetical protein